MLYHLKGALFDKVGSFGDTIISHVCLFINRQSFDYLLLVEEKISHRALNNVRVSFVYTWIRILIQICIAYIVFSSHVISMVPGHQAPKDSWSQYHHPLNYYNEMVPRYWKE